MGKNPKFPLVGVCHQPTSYEWLNINKNGNSELSPVKYAFRMVGGKHQPWV
jgi:hypothetical protein